MRPWLRRTCRGEFVRAPRAHREQDRRLRAEAVVLLRELDELTGEAPTPRRTSA